MKVLNKNLQNLLKEHDPYQIQKRLKVKFSHERGLKAGRFHDPNALYLKMFEQKPPPAQQPKGDA